MTTRQPFGTNVTSATNGAIKPRRKTGAMWQKQTKDNETYFDLEIEGTKEFLDLLNNSTRKNSKTGAPIINVRAFVNKDKTENKHPDYRILLPNPDYNK